jgi:hypothetical protein
MTRIGQNGFKQFKQTNHIPFLMVLAIVFSGMVAAAFLTPLDWTRYYLFPVVLTTLFLATGIEQIFRWLAAGFRFAWKKRLGDKVK